MIEDIREKIGAQNRGFSNDGLDPKLRVTDEEALYLFREASLPELGELADTIRNGLTDPEVVSYVVDRNINYTNVCVTDCSFCAFYRSPGSPEGYWHQYPVIKEKIEEMIEKGGSRILMQGGHNPAISYDYYTDLLRKIKEDFNIHIHGFSPAEIWFFHRRYRKSLEEILSDFKEAGLDSIPGGGAEILSDRVRREISPLKAMSDQWLEVMETAHRINLMGTATMMFGHVETLEERVEHLRRIRDLQDRYHGFSSFIPWTYQRGNDELDREMVGAHDYLKTLAISRIYIDNIKNVQVSWLTQGKKVASVALKFGGNDMGSTLLEENVIEATGIANRLNREDLEELILNAGYRPAVRDNFYRILS